MAGHRRPGGRGRGGRWRHPCPPAPNSGHTEASGSSSADQPVVDQLQEQQGHEGLAHRVDVDQGVRPPGSGAGGVGPPADQVDHRVAVDEDGHRRPRPRPARRSWRRRRRRRRRTGSSHRPETGTSAGRSAVPDRRRSSVPGRSGTPGCRAARWGPGRRRRGRRRRRAARPRAIREAMASRVDQRGDRVEPAAATKVGQAMAPSRSQTSWPRRASSWARRPATTAGSVVDVGAVHHLDQGPVAGMGLEPRLVEPVVEEVSGAPRPGPSGSRSSSSWSG